MTNDETPIRLVDLPRLLPRRPDGAMIDFSTVWSWATAGRPRPLATAIVDGERCATLSDALEFLDGGGE